MTASEWEAIKRLFDAAINVPPDDRDAWLDEACKDKPELRSTLEELIRSFEVSVSDQVNELESMPVFSEGQTIAGRFTVLRLIARGGMGEVYEVQDQSFTHVRKAVRRALKTIRTDLAGGRETFERVERRFKQEILVAQDVTDQGICKVYDLVEHTQELPDGRSRVIPCLTMELLDGDTLSHVIARHRPMTPEECFPLVSQILRALRSMHVKEIAHRDVKPSNIMLVDGPDGPASRAVLMDFGLAKPFEQRSIFFETLADRQAGAPYFIAPEVIEGERGGVAVDIYALGLVLDEMVTASPAFPTRSLPDLLWRKVHGEPEPIEERSSDLPERWVQTIRWCLQKDPANRPQSVDEILAALEGVGDVPSLPVAPPQLAPAAETTSLETARPRRLVGRRWVLGAASAGAVATFAAVLREQTSPITGSILVFPFENKTDDEGYDYLCSSAANEVMRRLLFVSDLRVYPLPKDLQEFPEPRKDYYSLTGSLEEDGGERRLTIRLHDYMTGELVWMETFDRQLANPLNVESKTVDSILSSLGSHVEGRGRIESWVATLLGKDQPTGVSGYRPGPAATASPTAHQAYLEGRMLWQRRNLPDALKAIDKLEQAVRIDSGFALAHSGLADVQHVLLTFNHADTPTLMSVAREHAERAVDTGPALPETHLSLAAVRQMLWDWRGSEASYQTAMKVQPRMARAHHWYAGLRLQFGAFAEALSMSQRAIDMDPYDYPSHSAHGLFLWYAGRIEEAARHFESLLSKVDLVYSRLVLGQVYAALSAQSSGVERNRYHMKSIEQAGAVRNEEIKQNDGVDPGFTKWADLVSVQAYAARADREMADLHISRLEKGLAENKVAATTLSWAYAAVGEQNLALDRLELGTRRQEREMLYTKVHPLFESLHGEARFQAILNEMNLT